MKLPTTSLRAALIALALGSGAAIAAPAADMPKKKGMKMTQKANPMRSVSELVANIQPASGSNVKGTVVFKKVSGGVEIMVNVGGLEPNSEHGFHIHEFGNINAIDGASLGGHYNPEGHQHALPDQGERHAGDFGNLKTDNDGNVSTTITVNNLTLAGPMNPIIGRGVVIHAKKDDGGQPSGNAGERIGMGVIGVSKAAPGKMKGQKKMRTENPPEMKPSNTSTTTTDEVVKPATATPADADGVVAPAPPVGE